MQVKDELPLTVEIISPNREKTPEGYLLCKGVTISKVGEFEYNADEVPTVEASNGKVVMRRTEEELFAEDTVRSFEGKPVVIGHDTFADPSNWSDITVGIVSNVRRGEGAQASDLIADLLLTKDKGIALVESGLLTELSCGYDAQAVDDGEGKGHQEGIVGNHVALVQRARCGSTCQIKDGNMTPEFIEKLRALFDQGNKEAFESALAELATADEEPAAETPDAEAENPAADEEAAPAPEQAEEQADEEVAPEKTVEDRIAALEAGHQEIIAKLDKLLATGDEEAQDEDPEEVIDEESEVASSAEVREVLDEAEELCPGIKLPAGDCANGKGFTVGALNRIKRNAIKNCAVNCFGDAAHLSGEALDVALQACVKLVRAQKNPSIKTADSKPTAQGFNARNAAFWKRS